eukprot:scaffold318296_cov39-Tisochrysis_lutea.AAC.1
MSCDAMLARVQGICVVLIREVVPVFVGLWEAAVCGLILGVVLSSCRVRDRRAFGWAPRPTHLLVRVTCHCSAQCACVLWLLVV